MSRKRAWCAVLNSIISLGDLPPSPSSEKLIIDTQCNQEEIARLALYSPQHVKVIIKELKEMGVLRYSYFFKYEIDLDKASELLGNDLNVEEYIA